jgi:NADPH:quinone reductase-like Zn-dependent oxidoreductase/SAM-dependent methyltransferase/acyl carrier protein
LLDACFQSVLGLIAAQDEGHGGETYLPVQIRRLRFHVDGKTPTYCHARMTRRGIRSMIADLRLLTASGEVVAEFEGFRFQRVDLGAQSAPTPIYEVRPELRLRAHLANSPLDTSTERLDVLSAAVAARIPEMVEELRRARFYSGLVPQYLKLCGYFAARALERLGARDGPFTLESLMLPQHARDLITAKHNGHAGNGAAASANGAGPTNGAAAANGAARANGHAHRSPTAAEAYTSLRERKFDLVRDYLQASLPASVIAAWPRTAEDQLKVGRRTLRQYSNHHPRIAQLLKRPPGSVLPLYETMLSYLVEMAEEDGFLVREEDHWTFRPDTAVPDPMGLWRELVAEFPNALPELLLVGRCGEHLVEILTGTMDPLQIVNLTPLEHLYESGPYCHLYNRLLSETIKEVVRALPPGRSLRILEIGAGTGAATSSIVSHLPRDRTEYIFTDVSESFLASAEVKFADYPFLRYALLDIGKDAAEQGFDLGSYDIVVASNVLHATPDIKATLSQVRKLLAVDGVLLLQETHRFRMVDIVFGLLKDWWAFRDKNLRQNAPVLSADIWPQVLADVGFDDVRIFNESQVVSSQPLQSVMLARKPSRAVNSAGARQKTTPRTWLLLTSDDAEMDRSSGLGRALSDAGHRVITVRQGAIYSRFDESAYALDPTDGKQLEELVRDLGAENQIDEIVHLWGVDFASPQSADALLKLQDLRCISAVNLVQALQKAGWARPPRLWLVTSGAIARPGLRSPVNPEQAPLWGLGRVIQNEQPDLACRMIDLNPADDPAAILGSFVNELLHPNNDDEILLSAGMRHVNVIRRTSAAEQLARSSARHTANGHEQGFKLDFISQGSLENLYLRPATIPTPSVGQVLLEVRAAGLNFRDVMWAMGMLPEEALENGFSGPTLGMECSGVVVAVGDTVQGVAVGDEVVAFASACFGKYVIAEAVAIAPKPAHLSFAAAATIPTVFFTAYYALDTLARLEKGERILIHGAAGGVGLAAIQIAKHRGAEVFATAGTAEKRDFLKYLGADHVLDSRSLEFADRVVEICGGGGVDVVLNSLAGEAIYRNLRMLNPFGRFLEIGKRDLYANSKIGLKPFCNNISYFAIDADQFLIEKAKLAGSIFKEVMLLVDEGVFRPLVHRVFPISRVVDAFRHMQQSKHIGKIVVTMDDAHLTVTPELPDKYALRADATYLISGGLGGFGLATARWMVDRGARHLVLLGRRGAATAEARRAIAQLEKAGATVVVAKADISRTEEVRRVFETDMAGLPPLRGVLHAAMVLDDHLLLQSNRERFMRAMRPKMLGAWNLHHLTEAAPLDFFVLYSSATSLIGNPGQANYVAGNLYLESLASYRRSKGLAGLSVAWGGIEDVGYLARHADLRSQMEERINLLSFPAAQALGALERLLLSGAEQVAPAGFNWSKTLSILPSAKSPRFDVVRTQGSMDASSSEGAEEVLALLAELPEEERAELVTQVLAEQVAKVLRTAVAKLDVNKSLLDMGVDSLMGVEMKMVIDKQFGVDIPAMEMMGGASISQIARRILALSALPAAAPRKSQPEPLKAIYEEIDKEVDELSDETLDAYIAQLAADQPREAERIS